MLTSGDDADGPSARETPHADEGARGLVLFPVGSHIPFGFLGRKEPPCTLAWPEPLAPQNAPVPVKLTKEPPAGVITAWMVMVPS